MVREWSVRGSGLHCPRDTGDVSHSGTHEALHFYRDRSVRRFPAIKLVIAHKAALESARKHPPVMLEKTLALTVHDGESPTQLAHPQDYYGKETHGGARRAPRGGIDPFAIGEHGRRGFPSIWRARLLRQRNVSAHVRPHIRLVFEGLNNAPYA